MTSNKSNLQFGLRINQAAESHFNTQEKQVLEYLSDKVATATMVSNTLGIPQKNITRYKRSLEEKGLLREVKKVICPFTRHIAWNITTDKSQFPEQIQLNLFYND